MQVYFIRHQESYGNLEGVIQGKNYNSGLTDKGKAGALQLAENLQKQIKGKIVRRVISSPMQRAKQAAKIIADRLMVPMVCDPSLVEVNPGVLADLKKDEAKKFYPKYLAIWEKRGDLDGIPGAESGNELQARALYFLERFFSKSQNEIEIVVSHAGFMRSIINTAKNESRIKPVDYKYDKIHLLENPWKTICVSELKMAKASSVYKIITPNQTYTMKKMYGATKTEMEFQNNVSRHLANHDAPLPSILYWGTRDKHSIQILSYLDGEHSNNELTKKQMQNCILETYKLGENLKNISDSSKKRPTLSLGVKITSSLNLLLNTSIVKKSGKKLLVNLRYKNLINRKYQVLVHYDLHRSNIIFSGNNVKFLDYGSFIYAPEDFLPASLFMAFFMLNNSKFSLSSLITEWPRPLNRQDVIILMWARAIIGASFFEKKITSNLAQQDDYLLYDKYLNCLNQIKGMI